MTRVDNFLIYNLYMKKILEKFLLLYVFWLLLIFGMAAIRLWFGDCFRDNGCTQFIITIFFTVSSSLRCMNGFYKSKTRFSAFYGSKVMEKMRAIAIRRLRLLGSLWICIQWINKRILKKVKRRVGDLNYKLLLWHKYRMKET